MRNCELRKRTAARSREAPKPRTHARFKRRNPSPHGSSLAMKPVSGRRIFERSTREHPGNLPAPLNVVLNVWEKK